jgi:hypothetical protein
MVFYGFLQTALYPLTTPHCSKICMEGNITAETLKWQSDSNECIKIKSEVEPFIVPILTAVWSPTVLTAMTLPVLYNRKFRAC